MSTSGRILITDDDKRFQDVTSSMLERAGYECDSALDASEALRLLQKNSYDLILADIKMPGNLNMEFIRELPDIAEGVPIIIVTGYPSLQSALQAIGLSVKGYLVKPFDYHILLSQVRAWMEHSEILQARQELEKEKKQLTEALETAKQQIETLHRLLPVCPACDNVRDESAYLDQTRQYIHRQKDIDEQMMLCAECLNKADLPS